MLSIYNPFAFSSHPSTRKLANRLNRDSDLSQTIKDSFDYLFDSFSYFNSPGINYIKNEDQSLTISVDLPGVSEKDISIEINQDILSIKAERKSKNSSYNYSRSFNFPENYQTDNIAAELKDGVLSLNLKPKEIKAETKPIKIPLISK